MNRRCTRGFSFVELMIVVVILAIIAAVAIPALISTRTSAEIKSTYGLIRTISSGEQDYYTDFDTFADFPTLAGGGFLDERFSESPLEIYNYTISIEIRDGGQKFLVTATTSALGAPTFKMDESYLIVES